MCDDKFITEEEYTKHVKEHLEEIKDIDIEFLKNGHEILDCSTCKFQSNKPEAIKTHLPTMYSNRKTKLKTSQKLRNTKQQC